MYETATNYNSCEFDIGEWSKPGKSEPSSWWSETWVLRMGCPACDRRRSGVCNHQAADSSSTATPTHSVS